MIAHLVGRAAAALTRYAHRHGAHHYLSTGCLHGEHAYCQGHVGQSGAKVPARCKFCSAPCECGCHNETKEPTT